MRLSAATIDVLPSSIQRPAYDRRQAIGIVHFGIGAFHRAHQAVYTDDALDAGERDWGIVGVSLRSANVAAQLNPQDGLFSFASRASAGTSYRVIGSVNRVLVAATEAMAVRDFIASSSVQVVTFTITEKGYRLAAGEPLSVFGYLESGLRQRRALGLGGLTLLSCDNLAGNGTQLKRLLLEYLTRNETSLAEWVNSTCTFPSSMVDRIVPATTDADRCAASEAMCLDDAGHVVAEPYSQWIVEANFAGRRPSWDEHGAEFVSDVRPYETAKLRMLNGAHSALAYVGLMVGYEYVHQAIQDVEIRALVEYLMREEAAASVVPASGQDLARYASDLVNRFGNSALNHRLEQIAMDGSQKIPPRWLDTLVFHADHGRRCDAILTGLAAWLLHVRGDLRFVDDPLADRLATTWAEAGEAGILRALFGSKGLVSSIWTPTDDDTNRVSAVMRDLSRQRRLRWCP